ncbi:ABC transporter permease [Ferdinandcohnia quinoae]|uniref:ABC transporter permease n=1 Tax=Fredinandcohnia quinoae TaxID=2918902 RepID=A0AAW5E3P1_9BACI|nr:ABC transporter permease [Fredinandcohnia sp. SECRCQ15]MCH1626983.1 ABC transporter permease [Fredinandcohnia sp. SECRCQ15]
MKFADQFRFVRQNMKKNKTRIFMTVLATAMGCTFLIVLASVGFGLQKSVVKDITERQIVTQIDVHGKEDSEEKFQNVTDVDIAYFEGLDNVKAVTRRQMLNHAAIYKIDGYTSWAETVVTHFPSEVKAGFELSEGHLPENSNEIVVGYDFLTNLAKEGIEGEELYNENGEVKEEFRYKEELLGKTLNLSVVNQVEGEEKEKTIPLTVVGISKKPTKEWIFDQNVFISEEKLNEIEEFMGTSKGMDENENSGIPKYDQVKIYANNMANVEDITSVLEDKNYLTYSVLNELKEVNMMFTIAKAGLIFIGTIAILIASIGIYNTMTMAVTERAPDIGIMKAIGANPGVIKRIFLIESSYIGLLGAFFGTIVAYGISVAVNFAIPFIIQSAFGEEMPEGLMFSYIPWTLPAICVSICLLVTIISGMRPAQRATRIDVLKAMRREV